MLRHTNDFFANIAAILMGSAIILSVLFNFMSIKLYSVIPMPLYLFFPSVAVLIPVIADTLMPLSIRVNEKAQNLKEKWSRNFVHSAGRKYLRRKLMGINPLHILCGIGGFNFLKLIKSTKAWFYAQILNYSISALLTEPGH